EQEKVEAYMELVREELKQQVFRIKNLALPKAGESKDQIRDFAEKSSYLLDFIVSHGEMTTAEKNYLKAFLLQKIRSKESLSFIQELYEELQGYFQEKDPEGSRRKIQEMVKKLWEQQDKAKKKHILQVLEKHLPQLDFTAEQLNEMLSFGVRSQGDVSFDQRVALHLEEIEMALFEMELENMSAHPEASRIKEQQKLLNQELKALEEDIDDFKKSRYSLNYSIDQLPEDTASAAEKERLRSACDFLKKHEGESEEALKNRLESIDRIGVEAFLREAETKAETYLCETAEPPFQRESLEMLRKNAPYFDIFVIVTEQERYANRPQATAEKPSEYHENVDTLQKLEDLIKIMEAEVKAQF